MGTRVYIEVYSIVSGPESHWVSCRYLCPGDSQFPFLDTDVTVLLSSISFCFLHNPKFWQADASACHLLSHWFLACLILQP
jgi:hypothetical protein